MYFIPKTQFVDNCVNLPVVHSTNIMCDRLRLVHTYLHLFLNIKYICYLFLHCISVTKTSAICTYIVEVLESTGVTYIVIIYCRRLGNNKNVRGSFLWNDLGSYVR